MSKMEQTPHIAVVPSPGMGHLIPLIEFAKRLVNFHNVSVTVIVPTIGTPPKVETAVLESLPKAINYVHLAPVSFEDLPKDSKVETTIFLAVTRSLSSLRGTIKLLVARTALVALISDPFGTDAFSVAKEFDISPYLFFTSNAMNFAFSYMLPKFDETMSCEFRELPDPVIIPGCIPVHGGDLMDPVQDRTNEVYKLLLHHTKQFSFAEGVLLNSFIELEEGAIKALQGKEPGKLPVYPIGPLIQTGSSDEADPSECMKWLDNQPSGSVLFISFGSGGTLSYDQLIELALGLEMSGQFLWVARAPNDNSSNAAFFSVESQNDPLSFLPKGFLNRTKGQGIVVSSWAPQTKILAHGSTGGFLSHCGWNSTLESVVHGVPLIAWPLYAEQKMNAIMLAKGLKVALRPKVNQNGIVERDEIGKVVKSLIEGEEGKKVRSRMKEVKDAATKVLREDGSSTKSLSELVKKWKNKIAPIAS